MNTLKHFYLFIIICISAQWNNDELRNERYLRAGNSLLFDIFPMKNIEPTHNIYYTKCTKERSKNTKARGCILKKDPNKKLMSEWSGLIR